MRPNRLIWTLGVCAVAVIGVPAAAGAPAKAPGPAEAVFPVPREAAAKAASVSRHLRRERQERREQREGPVHPLVGEPDYGTAENAFGAARSGHSHGGQDVFAPAGTPLVAVTETEVIEAGTDGAQGNYAHLYDPEADRTYVYMHMIAPPSVEAGDELTAGQRDRRGRLHRLVLGRPPPLRGARRARVGRRAGGPDAAASGLAAGQVRLSEPSTAPGLA